MIDHQHVDCLDDSLPAGRPTLGAFGRIVGIELSAGAAGVAVELEHEPIVPLAERKARILGALDDAVIVIGAELIAAKDQHRGEFMEWVAAELPFGIDKAERLMAITRALAEVPEDRRAALPRAWTALYELSRVPPAALARSIDVGDVMPTMTTEQAREYVANQRAKRDEAETVEKRPEPTPSRMADAHALSLMRHNPTDLTPDTLERLQAWMTNAAG